MRLKIEEKILYTDKNGNDMTTNGVLLGLQKQMLIIQSVKRYNDYLDSYNATINKIENETLKYFNDVYSIMEQTLQGKKAVPLKEEVINEYKQIIDISIKAINDIDGFIEEERKKKIKITINMLEKYKAEIKNKINELEKRRDGILKIINMLATYYPLLKSSMSLEKENGE